MLSERSAICVSFSCIQDASTSSSVYGKLPFSEVLRKIPLPWMKTEWKPHLSHSATCIPLRENSTSVGSGLVFPPGIDSCQAPLIGYCRNACFISVLSGTVPIAFSLLCSVIGKSEISDSAFFLHFFQDIHDLFHRFFRIISVKPVKIDHLCSQSP